MLARVGCGVWVEQQACAEEGVAEKGGDAFPGENRRVGDRAHSAQLCLGVRSLEPSNDAWYENLVLLELYCSTW